MIRHSLPVSLLLACLPTWGAEPLPDGAVLRLGEARFQAFSIGRTAAFSPDGKRLATGGANSPVCVWDAATGKLLYATGITGSVHHLAWKDDGKLAGVNFFGLDGVFLSESAGEKDRGLSSDERSKLYQQVDKAPKRPGRVSLTALSDNGKRFAALRELEKGERAVEVSVHKPNTHTALFEPDLVLSLPRCDGVWLSRDGNTLFAHQNHPQNVRQLSAFDLTAKKPDESVWQVTLPRNPHGPQHVLSADGKRVVVQYPFGKTELWDGPKGEKLRTLDLTYTKVGPHVEVPAIALSADSRRVAIGLRQEGGLMGGEVIDFDTGKSVAKLTPRPLPLAGELRFTPDGKRLARVASGVVALWDADTGKDALPVSGHSGPVHSVLATRDGKTVVTAGADMTVRGWSPDTGKELWRRDFLFEVRLHSFGLDLMMLPNWRTPGETKLLFDLNTGRTRALPGGMAGSYLTTLSADGTLAATVDSEKSTVGVWDWPTGKHRSTITLEPPDNLAHFPLGGAGVQFTPDGKQLLLATTYQDPKVPQRMELFEMRPRLPFRERWDLKTGKRIEQTAEPHRPKWIAVANGPRTIHLHEDGSLSDAASGAGLGQLMIGEQPLQLRHAREAVLSPDGKTLAVARDDWTSDGAINLFDLATGKLTASRKAGERSQNALAYLPDGRLVSAGEGVFVWAAAK